MDQIFLNGFSFNHRIAIKQFNLMFVFKTLLSKDSLGLWDDHQTIVTRGKKIDASRVNDVAKRIRENKKI
ncbi:hypothetical protein D0962_23945 [Leptolyngbyaceae cyanobacterium CCMR0082]|uniref:Uncharacterized protein n=1 Tax=Adonisia turfae CCMR0082 TaxID=2304604 RepID=A0A6M0SCR9_9CYAN|nr:hypothetical protein [Adonisia turfae CCMR0082]